MLPSSGTVTIWNLKMKMVPLNEILTAIKTSNIVRECNLEFSIRKVLITGTVNYSLCMDCLQHDQYCKWEKFSTLYCSMSGEQKHLFL
jgi:hypothetical protein